jgi:hypothetical protein
VCNQSGPCTSPNECCSGWGCRAGSCQGGACGTEGQDCDTIADCCSFAASGKNYFCDKTGGGLHGMCKLEQPFQTCTTSADCAGTYPCRGGYCHYGDATRYDGWSCLDGVECKSGICTSTSAGVPGTCCSGTGTSCVAGSGTTTCCAPLGCTGPTGAQTCGACLDPENSGTGHPFKCTTYSQCCQNAGLACETSSGTCCKQNGTACGAGSECCSGETCGNVTTYQGTTANVCCGAFQGWCGISSPCCDGLACSNAGQSYPATCLKAAGTACQADAECTDWAGCKIATPPTGACCMHFGSCKTNSDCCSGVCDPDTHTCGYADPYGDCLTNADCWSMLNTGFSGQRCGGNANVGPLNCCPAPGQTCTSAADCCEAGDQCQTELYMDPLGLQTTAPMCCRPAQASCAQGFECCTGVCGYPGNKCCGYPYMTSFSCTSDADCCDSSSVIGSKCDLTSNRCCWKPGQPNVGNANASQCCSGRVDQFGSCK